MPYLDELNEEQKRAVTHTEGPLLVLAGAGSGKTRVITYRILHLITQKRVSPLHILAVTFTNKAADEMKERVRLLAGRRLPGLTLSTFHSLGVRILKENIPLLGYKNNFSIHDENDKKNRIKSALSELHLDSLEFNLNSMASHISLAKNTNLFIRYFDAVPDEGYRQVLRDVYKRYEESMKNCNCVDFDDLIILPVKILSRFPEVREKYHKKFRYILVDEYQDTNSIQYQFVKQLLPEDRNICVVGDDDQAIYGFRGSKIEHILRFEKDFPGTRVITLTRNYRSVRNILLAASGVIKNNKERHPKEIVSAHGAGEKILLKECPDETREAEFVSERLFDLHRHHHVAWKDMAVLYRTNFQSRPFEEAFRLRGIPYEVVGGMEFYDRKEVKDILSYLKVIANEKDELSLLRILNYPGRGIGDRTVYELNQYSMKKRIGLFQALREADKIDTLRGQTRETLADFTRLIESYKKEFFNSKKPLYKAAHELVREIRLEDALLEEFGDEPALVKRKMNNVSELVSSIRNYEEQAGQEDEKPDLYRYLNRISLYAREEEQADEAGSCKVFLMTLHLSKGLEFSAVFLTGCESDLIPHQRSMEEGGVMEEERRLFYVGMTRAKSRLILSRSLSRMRFGLPVAKEPSPFLSEIPAEYITRGDEKADREKERERSKETIQKIKELLAGK